MVGSVKPMKGNRIEFEVAGSQYLATVMSDLSIQLYSYNDDESITVENLDDFIAVLQGVRDTIEEEGR